MTTIEPTTTATTTTKIALVFGANSEQGRAVIEGLVDTNQYIIVYAMLSKDELSSDIITPTDHHHPSIQKQHSNDHRVEQYFRDGLGATVIVGDMLQPEHVRKVLQETMATHIYITTTTNLPITISTTTKPTNSDNNDGIGIYQKAVREEYECIQSIVHAIVEQYEIDHLSRHIVLSVRDDVQSYIENERLRQQENQNCPTKMDTDTNIRSDNGDGGDKNEVRLLDDTIQPLYDGSIVPHYSGKGKGGAYAMEYLAPYSPNIYITLLTIPFLYSNFLGYFTPLPDENMGIHTTQYNLVACFGSGSHTIDMMSTSDLSIIVPNVFANPNKYHRQNLRLVGEQISMDTIAYEFTDLFGKDVVYNPLTVDEVSTAFPNFYVSAPCMVQMCQYISHTPPALRHDLDVTRDVCFPKQPQTFRDWLLSHSESTAFKMVGLDIDAPEIKYVTVLGATSPEGRSVIKGLLADTRKVYRIRATTRHLDSDAAQSIKALDPDRIELIYADYDDMASCQDAVDGVDGVFLVTDFYEDAQRNMVVEERHARNVIDACEISTSIKHLVFSTMESMTNMSRLLKENHALNHIIPDNDNVNTDNPFDAKARAAAYARTKRLSVTYVLLPCYTQHFFDMIVRRPQSSSSEDKDGDDTERSQFVITIPLKDDEKVMCMNIDDLGPAVANIFDSYQVYAGHEIGLVTDFVSVAEVRDIINDVLLPEDNLIIETEEVNREQWIEVKDTYMKDLGQLFVYMSHSDAVRQRHSIAKTMKLVPTAVPLRHWIEQNVNNATFREKLGLR